MLHSVALFVALLGCGDDDSPSTRDSGSDPGDSRTEEPDVRVDAPADAGAMARLDDDRSADPMQLEDCQREPVASGRVYAKVIRCDEERIAGELAAGRVGDIVLRNARAAFVIRRATDSESLIGGPGGGLVDAASAGTEDVLKEMVAVMGLSAFGPSAVSDVVIAESGTTGSSARVRVVVEPRPLDVLRAYLPALRPPPIRAVIDYRLDADSTVLELRVQVLATRAVSVAPGLAVLLGGGGLGVASGSAILTDSATAGGATELLLEGLGSRTALGISMRAPAEIFRLDSLHLVTAPSMSANPTAVTEIALAVSVAPTAAEARAALVVVDESATFDATLDAPGPRTLIGIERPDGTPMVWSRPGTDGRLRARLPAGDYRVRSALESRPHEPSEDSTLVVGVAGGETSATAPAIARGVIHVEATAGGEVAPVRVTIASGAVSPVDSEAERVVTIGPTDLDVPAGRHRVIVSRGPEHDVHDVELDVAPGATVLLAVDLPRVVDSAGWVSCDFHLHSELSTDSSHPVLRALRQMAAEGLEVVASTDHDYLTDYPSLVNRAGVGDWLLAVVGDELSTSDLGHFGGYPLAHDPSRGANGAPIWFGLTPAEVFAALRAAGDGRDAVVQVHHPRLDRGFFGAIGLDPETGHATADPASLGFAPETNLDDLAFDVIEVWNGYTRGNNEEVFADWLGLRAAGRRFTMVGNSDSHRTDRPPGVPRTFVRVPDDTRGAFDWDDVEASLRAGRATVDGGIFVTIEGPAGEGPGDELVVTPGAAPPRAMVRVRVQAPAWIDVTRLRIYRGREVAVDRAIAPSGDSARFDETMAIDLDDDTFLVARADGERDAEPLWGAAPFGVTGALDVTLR